MTLLNNNMEIKARLQTQIQTWTSVTVYIIQPPLNADRQRIEVQITGLLEDGLHLQGVSTEKKYEVAISYYGATKEQVQTAIDNVRANLPTYSDSELLLARLQGETNVEQLETLDGYISNQIWTVWYARSS